MQSLVLSHQLMMALNANDIFDAVMSIRGVVYRKNERESRVTIAFSLGGQDYFIKKHSGIGWREIIKNLILGRRPITGAENEWRALQNFPKQGIETMTLVGYGCRGYHPAKRQSFVITKALKNTESLEDFCLNWRENPVSPRLKSALITKVADITRCMHSAGMNHRDLYICHFLLDKGCGEQLNVNYLQVYLIDLHRVQIKKKIGLRWRIKDLACLYFSSMNIGLTQRDLLRFLKVYYQQDVRDILTQQHRLLQKVSRRAHRQYQKYMLDHSSKW